MPPTEDPRPVPRPTPETRPYWDGCAAGELRLPSCRTCAVGHFFPPRTFCPRCWSTDVSWEAVSGRARLLSYVINQRPPPGWGDEPYAIAVVELAEGPRMMTNLVEVDQTPEALVLDMDLEVTFQARGEQWLPVFRPAGASS